MLMNSFINDWAIKQLLLNKAENNNSLKDINEIKDLVNDYRESLLINNYKEMLIKQQLDTVIKDAEIQDFYSKSKGNFRLNEELVKIKYLHFDHKVISKKEFLNKSAEVLFENKMKNQNKYFGIDKFLNSVVVESKENLTGQILFVKIDNFNHNSLFGKIIPDEKKIVQFN